MSTAECSARYRQYAADCVRQAQIETSSEDRTILLNVALAWLRLAEQTTQLSIEDSPPVAPQME